jgi:hypothetical protein
MWPTFQIHSAGPKLLIIIKLLFLKGIWTHGTIETLKTHRKVAFNPKYGAMGLLSYPLVVL